MELFRNIRLKIAGSILKRRVDRSSRKMVYSNFSDVKRIGIVWNASKHNEFQALSRFHQRMNERNIDVKILGYYDGKNLPDQYTAIRYLTCIRKTELDFFFIPESTEIKSFINDKFDILIDINFEKLFSLIYITNLSRASFKVGLYEDEKNQTPFDLMMEIEKPVNVDNYLKQIVQYLEMIVS
jgi:hypothetical protein